jgi:hypothetical protein
MLLLYMQVKRVVEGAAGVKISLRMRLSAKIVRNGQVSNGSVTLFLNLCKNFGVIVYTSSTVMQRRMKCYLVSLKCKGFVVVIYAVLLD